MTHYHLVFPPGFDAVYIIAQAGKQDQPVIHLFEFSADVQLISQIWRYAILQRFSVLVHNQRIIKISAGILHSQYGWDAA